LDKTGNSSKAKQGLALALASAFLLLCVPFPTAPVHAYAASVAINYALYGTLGSFRVVWANITNEYASSLSLVVFVIWKNFAGQTVAVTTGELDLARGATGRTFAPLTDTLQSGIYEVNVFVITTNNNPVSSLLRFYVAI
jgi:hypothetical protein